MAWIRADWAQLRGGAGCLALFLATSAAALLVGCSGPAGEDNAANSATSEAVNTAAAGRAPPAEPESTPEPPQPKSYTATLTCTYAGVPNSVQMCLTGNDVTRGSLKVRSGGDVHQYGNLEILQGFIPRSVSLPLTAGFEFEAQTNGDDDAILRVEIADETGQRIFADEASSFGVISVHE